MSAKSNDAVGFEIDEDYYDSACKRMELERKQMKLDFAEGE